MKTEKIKSKLKKAFNRVMGVLLPVSTLLVSCDTNALVVHAADNSNQVKVISTLVGDPTTTVIDQSFSVSGNAEIVAYLQGVNSGNEIIYYTVRFGVVENGSYRSLKKGEFSGTETTIKDGKVQSTNQITAYVLAMPYKSNSTDIAINYQVVAGNFKLFKSLDDVKVYASSGAGDYDIIKPAELEKGWYLKNVNGYVTADDSPSSEAGADATYIHFTWDTDNLQEGDLIEIKTHSYYKKIGGEKLSGFHDFITYSDGVSATSGEYSFSQYLPAKAWFNSLENKPLVFKEYDTTDYYIRPVRMSSSGVEKYGGWIHIGMGKRTTPTSSPWADPDNSGDYGDFNEDGDWITDEETTEKEGGRHGWLQDGTVLTPEDKTNPFTGTNLAGMFSYFFDFMKNIPSMLADLPALVSSTIGFLPPVIIGFIGIGVVIAIILRVVGR